MEATHLALLAQCPDVLPVPHHGQSGGVADPQDGRALSLKGVRLTRLQDRVHDHDVVHDQAQPDLVGRADC